jgi:hypothetical protein
MENGLQQAVGDEMMTEEQAVRTSFLRTKTCKPSSTTKSSGNSIFQP